VELVLQRWIAHCEFEEVAASRQIASLSWHRWSVGCGQKLHHVRVQCELANAERGGHSMVSIEHVVLVSEAIELHRRQLATSLHRADNRPVPLIVAHRRWCLGGRKSLFSSCARPTLPTI